MKRLINDVNNLTTNEKKKIRKFINARTTNDLLMSVKGIIDLGVRRSTQEKRAYRFIAEEYNSDIRDERRKKKIETEKKKVVVKRKIKTKIKENTYTIVKGKGVDLLDDTTFTDFYNLLKTHHKQGTTINVIKKGGKAKMNFSFTFSDKFTKDWKNLYQAHIFIDSENDAINSDDGYTIYVNVGEKIKGSKIIQAFKLGVTNCMFVPMIEWCEAKEAEASTKKTAYRYSGMKKKLIQDEKKYRDSGVSEADINFLSNKYQVNIEVNTPFQKNFIKVKSDKKALTTFKFINTRIDHVEHNKVVNLDPMIIEQDQLNEMAKSLRNKYHTYTKNMNGVSSISTEDKTYRTPNEYSQYIRKFEDETGIINYYLDDFTDVEVSKFIRQGVHFNETIDFKSYDEDYITMKNYKHIDMEKAYATFYKCKYFKKFLGRVTDYRKTNKIVGLGYYRIENINFDNANDKLKEYNEYMKIYNDNVYPSFELEFLKDNGVEFDIIEGCWGSTFDFRFDDIMLDQKDGAIKYYCKYVGSMFYYSEYKHFYMNCDKKLAEHIKEVSDYDMVSFNDYTKEVQVSYKKQHNNHLSHICGFITSYMRLNVLEQLFKINSEDVVRVCVDGIYYEGMDIECVNSFRDKPEFIKPNTSGEYYISNYDCDIEYCGNEYRDYYSKQLHKGVGGSGKTHLNIYDGGLIKKIFVAPSWKLSRKKNKECGISNQVWANIVSDDPEKTKYIQQNFNVLIIDEVSMMTNEAKELLFERYNDMKIIMCGDCGFQCPQFEKHLLPFNEEGFDDIINYTINRRCKCEKLQGILDLCRDMITDKFLYYLMKKGIKQRITKKELKDKYKKEDMILCRTNDKKDIYTEMLKDVEKYYILKTDRKYCKGEIVYERPDKNYKINVDYEIRHAYTVHSIQGETAHHNLYIDDKYVEPEIIYTALSRAEYLSQIYIICG